MIQLIRTHLLAFGVLCVGCASYPSGDLGRLEFLAISGYSSSQSTILASDIEGEHCQAGTSFNYGAAVDNALEKIPGADAIANAEFSIRMTPALTACTQVRGDAVRMP
jgi:hypothetical protein